jgi:DNA-binding NarL/FixJ family response regulator
MRTRYARWQANPVNLLQCVIVDDDASFLEAAQALLEEDGVRVAGTASTRADAVQRVAALHPDVVLIDMGAGRPGTWLPRRRRAAGCRRRLRNGHGCAGRLVLER